MALYLRNRRFLGESWLEKLKRIAGASLYCAYMGDDTNPTNTVLTDYSGNGFHGTYQATGGHPIATKQQPGIDWGYVSVENIAAHGQYCAYPAAFCASFPGSECTIGMWVRLKTLAEWVDGLNHGFFCIATAGSVDYVLIRKNSINDSFVFEVRCNSITHNWGPVFGADLKTSWFLVTASWSVSGNVGAFTINGNRTQPLVNFVPWSAAPGAALGAVGAQAPGFWLLDGNMLPFFVIAKYLRAGDLAELARPW